MTSTISSNNQKNSFLAFTKWSLLKAVPIAVIYSGLLFLALPVLCFALVSNKTVDIDIWNVFAYLVPAISSIFTIIVGANMFGIFHKKRGMDLYGSLPAKRTTLFLSKYVAGIIVIIVPLLVFSLLGGIVPHISGANLGSHNMVAAAMSKSITIGVGLIASYTMFAFLALCCGTTDSTVISYIAINILYAFMIFCVDIIFGSSVPGFSHTIFTEIPFFDIYTEMYSFEPISSLVDYLFAPIVGTFVGGDINLFNVGQSTYVDANVGAVKHLVYCLLFIGTVLAGSLFVAKRRKNENVQSAFIYKLPKIVVTILATVSMSLLAGFLFASAISLNVKESYTAYVLYYLHGTFAGGLLAFTIITLLYNRGINNIVKALPMFAGSYVAVLVGSVIMLTGAFGVDTYVPKFEDVESVIVTSDVNQRLSMKYLGACDSLMYNTNYDELSDDDKQDYATKTDLWYFDKEEKIVPMDLRVTDENVIKNTIEMHKYIVDNLHKVNGNVYGVSDVSPDWNETPNDLQFIYRMKDGSVKIRTYDNSDYDVKKVRELYNKVTSSEVYKKQYLPIFLCDLDRIEDLEIIGPVDGKNPRIVQGNSYVTYTEKTEATKELLEALKKDILADETFVDTCDIDNKANGKEFDRWDYGDDSVISLYYDNTLYSSQFAQEIYGVEYEIYVIPKDKYKNVWNVLEKYSDDELNFEGKPALCIE
ncbi:MAG: hypothetical protein UIM53_00705 [Acutalibacteraceae bacterium]|nr:hypothetical protein [Acutalibacteraceae bacterium]